MSYLDFPSFVIAGSFYTDPSTMDNDPSHYDDSCTNPSPWQDPFGSHFFTFQDQLAQQPGNGSPRNWAPPVISAAYDENGNISYSDPLINTVVGSMDSPYGIGGNAPFSPAKMIDLDPYQQAVSMIYGFYLKLQVGTTTLVGCMDPCALNSVRFDRVLPTRGWQNWDSYGWGSFGGDSNASGVYQSVLRVDPNCWPAESGSPILDQLRQATIQDAAGNLLLAIRFVLDAYQNVPWHSADFRIGRALATIGPVKPGDPVQCLAGTRWLAGRTAQSTDPWNQPSFYGAPFQVMQGPADDPFAGPYVALDLGNALATTYSTVAPFALGELIDLGELSVYIGDGSTGIVGSPFQVTGPFYNGQGGIQRLPLTAAQATAAASAPFSITSSLTTLNGINGATLNGQPVLWQEDAAGTWVACDGRNFQLASDASGQTSVTSNVYVTVFGQPAQDYSLAVTVVPCMQGNGAATVPWSAGYSGNTSQSAGALQASVTQAAAGVFQLSTQVVSDPGSRTPELDCQLYFLCFTGPGLPPLNPNLNPAPPPQEQMVSCVAWASYPLNTTPTFAEVQSIMKVYDKLFRAMHQRMDLLDQQTFFTFSLNPPWVALQGAFHGQEAGTWTLPGGELICSGTIPYYMTREITDPRFMPIMRNLSPNKRDTVLYYSYNLQQQQDPPPNCQGDGEVRR